MFAGVRCGFPLFDPRMPITDARLAAVRACFDRNFAERGEIGASLSVWQHGEPVLSLAAGWCEKEQQRPWTENTLVPVYSATKGPAAASLLLALERHGFNEHTNVVEVWRGFPLMSATFADLLSHQCGLAALDQKASMFDHEQVVAAIEAQAPAWKPGDGHGYHPRTFGALVDEPVRRLTGMTLGEWFRREIAGPLGMEMWIGLPDSEFHRVARLYPGKAERDSVENAFYAEFNKADSMTRRAFSSPQGIASVQDMNEPAAWAAGLPAMGGVATADALARFYQAAIGAIASPLSENIRRALATPQSQADDRVLLRPTAFTCGCQKDPLDRDGAKLRTVYGPSLQAFGHPGAGGSHAFGDPESGLSFAYIMNQMELRVLPGPKSLNLVDSLYR